ncbi:MAG: hypothetical protein IJZ88_04055 [Clostridia bacterium]|nr:hypothetical protein [Clostridia bacterium]
MLLKYKEAEYENKIQQIRDNGYTVNYVDLDYEDFSTDVESQTLFAEFQLPNGGKSYRNYSAIVVWANYLENDDPSVERSYSGMPVPITFTADNNGNPVTCRYVFEDTATEGTVKLTITVTGTTEHTDADFKYFIDNLRGLMFIEGDECTLDPVVSLVVPNLKSFFELANNEKSFTINLTGKSKLLSLGDDECCCVDSAYKCYKIVSRKPSAKASDMLFDGTYYFTENSSYQLRELPKGTVINLTGYTAEEFAATSEATLYETAKSNSQIFKTTVTNFTPGCLYLKDGLIYPIAESLHLKNNIHIEGNGSTIMASAMKNDGETYIKREMFIIRNSSDGLPISNVTFENLIFKGRFDGSSVGVDDQCIKTLSEYPLLKNFKFENVKFDGFKYAVHTGSGNETLPTVSFDWVFNDCNFINVKTGFMISWSHGITVTNSHIDDCLCTDDKHHCVYIARGSSYITFDNCLLENSIGTGIVNSDALIATEHRKMHHNTFTNLQIRNCGIGMIIGSWSEHITINNIIATNVGRAIKLINCTDVNIDNFNATGCFYYEYIRKDEIGDTHWCNGDSEWGGISVLGYADVKITNSFFSTGGVMFSSGESGLLPDELDSKPINTNLFFENCIFVSTFSEYRPGSSEGTYYQPESCLGIYTAGSDNATPYYRYNVNFNSCQFFMNSENNERSMITLKGYDGNDDEKSIYKFTDCLIAYRDGNGNPNDDVLKYDKHGNPEITMPNSYFISTEEGAFANITNCVFYKNRENSSNSSTYGFIKDRYIDENNEEVIRYKIMPDIDIDTFTNTYIKELN